MMIATPRKVVNFAQAAWRRLLSGAHDASAEEAAKRMTICRTCPHFSGGPSVSDWSCVHVECGCMLEKKTRWASESCPVGQWGCIPAEAPDFGVVIGSYGMPSLIELQIRMLKDTCGELPILVADDCTPGAEERLRGLAEKYANVELWRARERIGHYGGDLAVFYNGVVWAMAKGFRWLVKVSQRFLVTKETWIQNGIKELRESGKALLSQGCFDNGGGNRPRTNLFVRTECCILDMERWGRAPVLQELSPMVLGNPTELKINHIIERVIGGGMHRWSLFTEERYSDPSPGIVWHCTHKPADYRALFEKHCLVPDPNFTTDGWQHGKDWVRG